MASVKKGTRFFIDASNVASVKKALDQFPPAFFLQGKQEYGIALQDLKAAAVKLSSNPPGPIAGTGVHRQTGRLAGSWGTEVTGSSLKDLKGAAFSFAAIKAPRLELGGDARPGGGTGNSNAWIFIPTDINKDPTGAAIHSVRETIDGGALFVNRHSRRWKSIPPAIVDGQASPAWNLLVTRNPFAYQALGPRFIMAKSAHYRPQLGFFDTGTEFSKVLPGKLADASVRAWNEANK